MIRYGFGRHLWDIRATTLNTTRLQVGGPKTNVLKLRLPIANRHSGNGLWSDCWICRDIERIDLAALSPPLRRRSTTQVLRLFRYALLHYFHSRTMGNLDRQYSRMRHTTGQERHATQAERWTELPSLPESQADISLEEKHCI